MFQKAIAISNLILYINFFLFFFFLQRKKKKKKLGKLLDEKVKNDCIQEIDLLKSLNHPNIVGFIDYYYFEPQAKLFIIVEMAESGDLSSMIRRYKNLQARIPEKTIW